MSGPVLMAVADVAIYVALLGEIGIVPLAVTTSLSINFLRKISEQICKLARDLPLVRPLVCQQGQQGRERQLLVVLIVPIGQDADHVPQ